MRAKFLTLFVLLGLAGNAWGQSPSPTPVPNQSPPTANPNPSAGGASQADFGPLMELIQSTVEPDSWIDNGGQSRMQPYAGGIRFDAKNLAAESQKRNLSTDSSRAAEQLVERNARRVNALARDQQDWKVVAEMRCISLHALQAAIASNIERGLPPDEAMINLAGISRLFGAMIDPERTDVLLIGSVGELDRHKLHGWIDRETSRPTLRLEDLNAMLGAINNDVPIGCSIDPTQAGLASVQTVANDLRSGKLKGNAANDALAKALGPQVISLSGVQPDDPGSIPLIAADRHMKMVALNQVKLPPKFDHYFTIVEKTLDQHGLPDGQLLRFWFTGKSVPIGTSRDGLGWIWNQTPIRLLSEREMADENGQRQIVGQDPRAELFAKQFTERFNELPRAEPIYGRLAVYLNWDSVSHWPNKRLMMPQNGTLPQVS